MGYFRAINYWVLGGFEGEKTPYQAIDDAKKMKLDGIELTFGDCLKEDITEEECNNIKKYANENNIGLKTLAAGFYWGCSLGSGDPAEREKAISFTERYIKVASWLNVDRILVIPGAVDVAWDESRPVISYKNVWDNATDSLNKVLKTAREYRVTICLENVWNKFLLSPVEFNLFLDQFGYGYMGEMYRKRFYYYFPPLTIRKGQNLGP